MNSTEIYSSFLNSMKELHEDVPLGLTSKRLYSLKEGEFIPRQASAKTQKNKVIPLF